MKTFLVHRQSFGKSPFVVIVCCNIKKKQLYLGCSVLFKQPVSKTIYKQMAIPAIGSFNLWVFKFIGWAHKSNGFVLLKQLKFVSIKK